MIKAVLFDLDNTLVDRQAAFRRVAAALYDSEPEMQKDYSREEASALLILWDEDGFAAMERFFKRVLETWPAIDRSIPELAERRNQLMRMAVEPDDRVTAFLRSLNESGMPWGIVTNGSVSQHAKIRSAGIEALTPFVIASEEYGHRKPNPPIYEEALRRLGGVSAENTLFVGDSPDTDIKGAQGMGMPTAWIRRGRRYPEGSPAPNYQIDHVDELRPLLFGAGSARSVSS